VLCILLVLVNLIIGSTCDPPSLTIHHTYHPGHETNTFSTVATPFSSFLANNFDGTPAQGFVLECAQRGVAVVRGPLTSAYPSARVEDAAFEAIVSTIVGDVCRLRDDGSLLAILLDLHGAMVTYSFNDAEGEVLRRVRQVVPAVPLGVAYDLHGNVTQEMVTHCTLMQCYKTYVVIGVQIVFVL
jgi:microcystin degradation protein MlrC